MNYWAIGARGGPARVFIQTANPAELIPQMKEGEEVAPVTKEQQEAGVTMLGDMQVGPPLPEGEE